MNTQSTENGNKKTHGILKKVGIFIVVAFVFIWIFVRPPMIKQNCAYSAKESMSKSESKSMKLYDNYYTICLRESGL